MKHFVEEYNYPIKGLESAKDPNLSDTIIKMYNKANEYKSTVGKEFYNMIKSLVKQKKPNTDKVLGFLFILLFLYLIILISLILYKLIMLKIINI